MNDQMGGSKDQTPLGDLSNFRTPRCKESFLRIRRHDLPPQILAQGLQGMERFNKTQYRLLSGAMDDSFLRNVTCCKLTNSSPSVGEIFLGDTRL